MAVRNVIRGDTYGVRRPFYTITLVDAALAPLDLTGATLFSTYKLAKTGPIDDPLDAEAVMQHYLVVNGAGVVTSSRGMALSGAASAGTVIEQMSAEESARLPLGVAIFCDVQLVESTGEVSSWIMTDTLLAIDAYTNRTEAPP